MHFQGLIVTLDGRARGEDSDVVDVSSGLGIGDFARFDKTRVIV